MGGSVDLVRFLATCIIDILMKFVAWIFTAVIAIPYYPITNFKFHKPFNIHIVSPSTQQGNE